MKEEIGDDDEGKITAENFSTMISKKKRLNKRVKFKY